MNVESRDAIDALASRLRHAKSIAELLAECAAVDDQALQNAFYGMADTIGDVAVQLNAMTAANAS